jgi:peptidoglycan hydrolase-like protein with peptidoglycan-binding domain
LAAIAGLNDDQKKLLADDSGNITDASIKAFQTSKQIAADAMIGNNTLRALGVNIPGITPQGRVVRPVNWDARNQTEYDKLD